MPGILAFVDTNVLLYAASTDPAEAGKRAEARRILSGGAFAFSVQVALAFLKGINPTTVVALDYELFEEATGIQQRFQISYWDAAIVAAAKRLNCRALYSEDLSDGQSYDGVRVVNPFRSAAKT
jgi:predicted nucleic acid-binding protein